MWGIAAAFPALGLAGTFNGFLFQATAGTITSVNFIPFTLLNTALSVISGLFSGASEAVAEYEHHQERRQDIDRICQLEGRACALEHTRTETPAFVRNIVQQGIQRNSDGFVAAENARRLNAATEYNKA